MNFLGHLQTHWHGERCNSRKPVPASGFDARVYKIALWFNFICPNRGRTPAGDNGSIYCHNSSYTLTTYRERGSGTTTLSRRIGLPWRHAIVEPQRLCRANGGLFPSLESQIFLRGLFAIARRAITVAPCGRSINGACRTGFTIEPVQRKALQGRLYTKSEFRTSLPNMSNEGAVL